MTSALTLFRKENRISLEALGDMLGVDKSTVLRWEQRRVPAERVLDIERLTGVSRYELRADIFGSSA